MIQTTQLCSFICSFICSFKLMLNHKIKNKQCFWTCKLQVYSMNSHLTNAQWCLKPRTPFTGTLALLWVPGPFRRSSGSNSRPWMSGGCFSVQSASSSVFPVLPLWWSFSSFQPAIWAVASHGQKLRSLQANQGIRPKPAIGTEGWLFWAPNEEKWLVGCIKANSKRPKLGVDHLDEWK